MLTVETAIIDTFPDAPALLVLASAATGIPCTTLHNGMIGTHRFTLSELHRIAIATGRRTTDLLGDG